MKILVLDDGIKGNFVQAYGIAVALSPDVRTIAVTWRGPCYSLPGRKGRYPLASKIAALLYRLGLRGAARKILGAALTGRTRAGLAGETCDLIISAGSVLAPVNLIWARRRGIPSVTVMVPAVLPLHFFDAAVIPLHDYLRLRRSPANLIVTLGAPNRVSPDLLERERQRLKAVLPPAPGKKIVGVLIGGDDQNYRISRPWTEKLFGVLAEYGRTGGACFLVSTSRRTPENVVQYLREKLPERGDVLYAEFPGYGPADHYYGILGAADMLVVTEDSVNMVSECAGAGKAVVIAGVERKHRRSLVFDRTMRRFVEDGYAEYVPQDAVLGIGAILEKAAHGRYQQLDEARECARKILKIIR
jgi:hypothetical protein